MSIANEIEFAQSIMGFISANLGISILLKFLCAIYKAQTLKHCLLQTSNSKEKFH